ncbi:MAG: hypothetical protein ACTMKY_00860 [Dermabacteraceae bacterium]|uniref:hypothetical protein n=1 Tax=Brachybacterium TaxID=43668 RepID=UPI003F9077AB
MNSASANGPALSLVTSSDQSRERRTTLSADGDRRPILAFQLSGSHIGTSITAVEDGITVTLTADRIEHTSDCVTITDTDDPSDPVVLHRMAEVLVPTRVQIDALVDDDRSAA